MIGELTSYTYEPTADGGKRVVPGESFVALFIVLSVELPTALPLGATGTGLYGVKGLFGMHVAPNRYLDAEGEPEPWYEWYKANRNGSGARNITKVVKWAPRFDNFAFGAGVTLGTVYDDGFTLNAGVLAAILIPGPVVMIEGRANLIKPRGDSGNGAEGALYALIVFDGIAETFQMNVDINYTLEDVITVGGGLEAFFDFNDGTRWYIYIGRREPLTKRIRAEILSIVSASAYFMLDPNAIQFGAAAGLDLQLVYGPLEIKLILRIAFHVELYFKEPQLGAMIELYCEISIRVFGFGIGLILQALLDGQAPQPWWIHGLARAALQLPFPLPSFDVSVEFTWGQNAEPARVELLKGASMVHPKLAGAAWALVDASRPASEWPVVPVDAIPAISLAKPLSDLSLKGPGEWFITEAPEGLGIEFGYALKEIVLEESKGDGGRWTIRRMIRSPGRDDLRFRPDAYAREPQVELWWFGPLDTFDKYSRQNYVDPCPVPTAPERHCVDWRHAKVGIHFSPLFTYKGLSFAAGMGEWSEVRAVDAQSATDPKRGLSVSLLTVRFPEPVSWIQVRWAAHRLRVVAGYRAGRLVVEPPPAPQEAWSHEPLGAGQPGLAVDTILLQSAPFSVAVTYPVLTSICWETQRELEASRRRRNPEDRSTLRGALVLQPHRSYRLRVSAVRREFLVGQAEPRLVPQAMTFGFHTGGLPGTDYGHEDLSGPGLANGAPSFAEGPLNRLETYVKRTIPSHGAPLFYRGYDVLVELADPYAAAMLAPVIDVVIKDRNGNTLAGRPGFSFLTGGLPFLTPGLLALLTSARETSCSDTPVPWTRQFLRRYIACSLPEDSRPGRMYRVELVASLPYGPQTVYGFEFALSRFKDASDHLSSGLVEALDEGDGVRRGRQPLRRLGSAAIPPFDWIGPVSEKLAAIAALQSGLAAALTVGEQDAGTTIVAATEGLKELRGELTQWMDALYTTLDRGGEISAPWDGARTLSYAGVQTLFAAAGLAHRPLPPRGFEALSIDAGKGYFLLLESPEPLDWNRVVARNDTTGGTLPVVWSGDGTRAFLFNDSPSRLFMADGESVRFSFNRGGAAAPDLDPLYRHGEMPAVQENVVWNLYVAA